MTTEIARFMRELEEIWDGQLEASLARGDLAGSLANLVAEPSVLHIPAMTGAVGRSALQRFYAEDLFGHLPADLAMTRISRTVDRFRLVDETTVSFTRDAEVLTIGVVGFQRGRISSQRTLWDHATLSAQLGLAHDRAAGQLTRG